MLSNLLPLLLALASAVGLKIVACAWSGFQIAQEPPAVTQLWQAWLTLGGATTATRACAMSRGEGDAGLGYLANHPGSLGLKLRDAQRLPGLTRCPCCPEQEMKCGANRPARNYLHLTLLLISKLASFLLQRIMKLNLSDELEIADRESRPLKKNFQ